MKLRYWLSKQNGPYSEVTKEEWMSAEKAAGFHGPNRYEPATAGFGGNGWYGKLTAADVSLAGQTPR